MELKYAMLFALLLVPLAAAVGGPAGMGGPKEDWANARAEMLGGAMDNVLCKTGFMTGALESVMENVNGTGDLQESIDTLEADVGTLQGFAESEDGLKFRDYLHESFAPHMRDARAAILDARTGASATQRQQMRADYESLRTEYASCNDESLGRFSDAKVNAYEVALDKAQERADNLSAKGIDTSGLDSLIDDARTQVVDPLKDALENAQNGTDVRQAILHYCLFNGCKDGENFHLLVKFEAEKLDSVLAYIKDDAESAGLSGDVDSAQADIDSAKGSIDDIGAGRYDSGVGKEVVDKLHSAAQTIKGILHKLRSG